MLRQTDIAAAFRESMLRSSKGYQYLRTRDFVCALQGQSFITRDGEEIEDYLVTGDGAPNLLKHSVEKAHTRWAHCYFFKRFISHPGGFILILTCSPMLALL